MAVTAGEVRQAGEVMAGEVWQARASGQVLLSAPACFGTHLAEVFDANTLTPTLETQHSQQHI